MSYIVRGIIYEFEDFYPVKTDVGQGEQCFKCALSFKCRVKPGNGDGRKLKNDLNKKYGECLNSHIYKIR